MSGTVENREQPSVAETVLAAIFHYNDRCQLLEERVTATLQHIHAKDSWTINDVRGCMHEIDVVRAELSDLIVYSRRWKHYFELEPMFVRHLIELQLLKETFEGIACLAPS